MNQLILPRSSKRVYTRDGMMTFDQATIDSAGAFLIGQLEKLDPTINEPLASVTWSRDIDMRTDVSMGVEIASYMQNAYAAAGGVSPNGKAWVGKQTNAITNIQLDNGKINNPVTPWAMQLDWTMFELASAQLMQMPLETQKYDGMQLKWNQDCDEQVYIGDTGLGVFGLTNSPLITPATLPAGAGGSTTWALKTPNEILADVNSTLLGAWTNSGYAVTPNRLLIPPQQYSYLTSTLISTAGNQSVLNFLQDNSIANSNNGEKLQILPLKWLAGRGAGGLNRMVAYTKDRKYAQFPLVPLQRTPVEYRDLRQITTYFGRIGVPELRYVETFAYRDGL